jgi:uncharacterized membrane protein YkvA (DUF1232 family)
MSLRSWRDKAKSLTAEVYAIYLSCRDPRVPLQAKVLAWLLIGYAISPIDFIPDFIPVIGQLDDLIIIPAGVAVVLKMIPKQVMDENRQKARAQPMTTRAKWIVAAIILSIYALIICILLKWLIFQ